MSKLIQKIEVLKIPHQPKTFHFKEMVIIGDS